MKFEDVNTGKSKSDEYGTPTYAVEPLVPYMDKTKTIWEPTDTTDSISSYLKSMGYNVISTHDDFFKYKEPMGDVIVTNPPYSKKTEFLERCYSFNIPFALLLPITALEGNRRHTMYKRYGLQLLIPNRRVNFVPSKSGSWFAVAWFTYKLNLPLDMFFVEIKNFENKTKQYEVDE